MLRQERLLHAPFAAVLAGSLALACGGEDPREADFENVRRELDEVAEGLGDAAAAMRDAMENATSGVVERPIGFRELYDFLPERLGDLERTSREGSTQGAMGMDVSKAEARYETEDGGSFQVEITDVGAVAAPALMGLAAWTNVNIDRESDDGWERTTEYRGQPAWEKFSARGGGDRGRVEFGTLIERRFLLEITGTRATWDELEAVRDDLDVGGLADMRDREG